MADDLSSFSKRKVQIEKNQTVCCHLHDDVTNRRVINPQPFCIDFILDGYYLYWYCEKCQKLYGLPDKGVFLYDEENLDDVVSNLSQFTISRDPERNPFEQFCNEQTKKYVPESLFFSLASFAKEDIDNIVKNTMKIPFGCVQKIKF